MVYTKNPNPNSRIEFTPATENGFQKMGQKEQSAMSYYTISDKSVDDAIEQLYRMTETRTNRVEYYARKEVSLGRIIYRVYMIGRYGDVALAHGDSEEVIMELKKYMNFLAGVFSWDGHEMEQQELSLCFQNSVQ